MTQEELDKDMIESIEMWLNEIEPKWVQMELAWLGELRTRLLEEDTPKDLEDAADNHIREVVDAAGHPGWEWETRDIKDAFIAGAKWQKQEMLKEAVEGFIFQSADYYPKQLIAGYDGELGMGDKVRIIVLKKEDEK